jgi:branched-chain amino acid transport system substrate-binding protein
MKRRFVIIGFSMAVFLCIGAYSPVFAQAPIKIGFAHVFSGGMATFGQVAKQGAELAIREINATGGIYGRPVKMVFEDTAVKPPIARKAVEKLVNKEKVDIVIGIVSSAVAKAVTPMMIDLKCPLIITHAMAHEVTGSMCNPWTFRITWNLDQCYKSAALLASELGARKWATVGPNYGFGQDSWKYFTKYLRGMGNYTFDNGIFTPMATKDWKPIFKQLKTTGADGIMLSLWGNNLKDFIRQGQETGFFQGKQILCPVGGSVEIFIALGFLRMPKGLWFGTPYWFEAYDNPYNRKFVEAYRSLSRARVSPSYAAYNAYAAVKMFKAAVEEAGTTNRAAVARVLAGLTLSELPVGKTTFRVGDHQAVYEVAYGVTAARAAKGSKRIRGLDPIRRFSGEQITPTVDLSDCKIAEKKQGTKRIAFPKQE